MKKCEKVDCTFIISLIAIAISTISIIFSIFSKEVDANWIAIFCGLLTVLLAIIVYFNLAHTVRTARETAICEAQKQAKLLVDIKENLPDNFESIILDIYNNRLHKIHKNGFVQTFSNIEDVVKFINDSKT